MKTTMPQFAVVYGRTDYFADNDEGLSMLFPSSPEEVRELATAFIAVIPDDLDYYQKQIKEWNGHDRLIITHQDDDTFLFSVTTIPVALTGDLDAFNTFVSTFAVPDDEEDDSEED